MSTLTNNTRGLIPQVYITQLFRNTCIISRRFAHQKEIPPEIWIKSNINAILMGNCPINMSNQHRLLMCIERFGSNIH
jgi:hypothetical protein